MSNKINIINNEISDSATPSSLNNSNTITRYPFNGRNKTLIDDFYIIGYNYRTLQKYLLKNSHNCLSNSDNYFGKEEKLMYTFQLKESPSLLNKMSNDYSKEILDIDIIINMIFPKMPNFYFRKETYYKTKNTDNIVRKSMKISEKLNPKLKYSNNTINSGFNKSSLLESYSDKNLDSILEKENIYENLLPKSYNVIFSSNPQSGTNSKKSINGFAHVFYRKFNKEKIISNNSFYFYVPIVFCIISEFPFYNSFLKLTKQIKQLFLQTKINVPIEIIIQNILNFTLSPINGDVFLDIEPKNIFVPKEESPKKNNESFNSIKEEDEDVTNNKIEKNKKLKYLNSMKSHEIHSNLSPDIKNDLNKNKRKSKGILKRSNTNEIFEKDKIFQKNSKKVNINQNAETPRHKHNNINFNTQETTLSKSPDNFINQNKINETNKSSKTLKILKDQKNFRNSLKEDILIKYNFKIKIKSLNEEYEKEEQIKFGSVQFSFLRGYPLIQYNLSKVLFSSLNTQDVLITFLYTFLEKDVIFFSKNIELLSLTINSYQNLNFPLNDEKYYFINGCVSYDNYVKGNSSFIGSAFNTIIGINDAYNSEYLCNSNRKLKEHLCVDLDSGEIHQESDKYDEDNNNNDKMFFNFVKKVCKNNVYKENNNFLFREIWKLHDDLSKYTDIDERFSYFDFNSMIKAKNAKIQESFYMFIINICINLYQNLKVHSNQNTTKINDVINVDVCFEKNNEYPYTNEEKYFLDELQDTMKFQSFIYGFIQSYNPIDLYKIPLTFTEEFISILTQKKNIKADKLKFFSLIDEFYYKMGRERFDIDLLPFLLQYYKKYIDDFDRIIIEKIKNNKLKKDYIISNDGKKKDIFYRWFELDNEIILHYLNFIKNLDEEEYNQMFHLAIFIKQNIIKEVLLSDIYNEIELHLINENIISESDICCGNILLLFTLTLKNFNQEDKNKICSFLNTFFYDFTIFRKYYIIIMNIVYKLMVECISKKDYLHAQKFLSYYYTCINSISLKNLVPNEQLMNLIKKFNSIDINQSVNNEQKEDKEQIKNQISFGDFIESVITSKNLYMIYNFNNESIIKEKQILLNANNNNVIKELEFNINLSKKYKKITPKLKFMMGKNTFETEIYSQKYILEMLTKEYDKFNQDLDNEKLDSIFLLKATMNIFLFMRNYITLPIKNEITKVLDLIFYVYFGKYIKSENNQK